MLTRQDKQKVFDEWDVATTCVTWQWDYACKQESSSFKTVILNLWSLKAPEVVRQDIIHLLLILLNSH